MKRLYILIICSIVLATTSAQAVDCSSASTVNSALAAASNGSTVTCDSGGTYTWTSDVTMSSSKYLTFNLNGATIQYGDSNAIFAIEQHASEINRVTNGVFTRVNGDGDSTDLYTGKLHINSGLSGSGGGIVLDNITFNNSEGYRVAIEVNGIGPSLIHSSIFNIIGTAEFIHVTPWGGSDDTGWIETLNFSPGGDAAFYMEGNTVNGDPWNSNDWVQSYYGGRMVIRFNTITGDGVKIDTHGNLAYNGRWWEYYGNDATAADTGILFCQRGGSGIIFNNTNVQQIIMVEENDQQDQVGKGQDFNLYPAYEWDNDEVWMTYNASGCAASGGTWIIRGTHVITDNGYGLTSGTSLPATCSENDGYWKTDAGGNWDTTHGGANDGALYKCTSTDTWTLYYTPLEYPHPARSEAASTIIKKIMTFFRRLRG